MTKDNLSAWNTELSKKLELLNYLEPIINLKKMRFKDLELKDMSQRYDILAIVLIIINEIIESFDIQSNLGLGLTKDDIINRLLPFLKRVDQVDNVNISQENHIKFLEELLKQLTSKEIRNHQIVFRDYLDENLLKRKRTFSILQVTIIDDLITYTVDITIVNIFKSLAIEHPIEDEIEGNKHLLEIHIKNKKPQLANNKAIRQINASRTWLFEIDKIISNLERKYDSKEWREDQRLALIEAEKNVTEWLSEHTLISKMIANYFSNIPYSDPDYTYILELTKNIEVAIQYFLAIYRRVLKARETFFKVHWSTRIFDKEESIKFNLEPDLLVHIFNLNKTQEIHILNGLIPYFQQPIPPQIHSLVHTFNYLTRNLSQNKKETKKVIEIQKTFFEPNYKISEDHKLAAWFAFYSYSTENKRFSLSAFIDWMIENNFNYQSIIYITLLFGIRCDEPFNTYIDSHTSYNIQINQNGSFLNDKLNDYTIKGSDLEIIVEEAN